MSVVGHKAKAAGLMMACEDPCWWHPRWFCIPELAYRLLEPNIPGVISVRLEKLEEEWDQTQLMCQWP